MSKTVNRVFVQFYKCLTFLFSICFLHLNGLSSHIYVNIHCFYVNLWYTIWENKRITYEYHMQFFIRFVKFQFWTENVGLEKQYKFSLGRNYLSKDVAQFRDRMNIKIDRRLILNISQTKYWMGNITRSSIFW